MAKEKNKLFIALGVFIGVIILTVFVLWQFLLTGLSDARNEYRANRRVLSEIEQKADLKSDLAKELGKISSDLETVRGALLAGEDKLKFIQEIENIALANGNTYEVRGTQEVKDPKTNKLREIDFSANLKGSFEGAFGFLEGVRSMPYIINIRQVEMRNGDDGVINTDVVLKIYLQ